MSRRERIFYLCGVILICLALRWYYHRPCSQQQAAQRTDQAVTTVEQTIKSQDAVINNITTGAGEEVSARNEAIRTDVQALSPDGVAADLMALLNGYRRERGD